MGRTVAIACQTNKNYCYLETGFCLFVEYSLEVTTVVLHAHIWYATFCIHNLINRSRTIVKLGIVNFSTNRREEKGIVPDLAVGSDQFCASFLKFYAY
jgi:hypothetical protein